MRPTRSGADLTLPEPRAGGRPDALWGLQQDAPFPPALDFVLPSPSGLVRLSLAEKLVWYQGLARLAAAR